MQQEWIGPERTRRMRETQEELVNTVAIDDSPNGRQESKQPLAVERCADASNMKENQSMVSTAQCQQHGTVRKSTNLNEVFALRKTLEGESSSSAAVKSKVNADRKDQEVSDGFSNEGNIWSTITYCTKEQILGSTAGATAVLRYPAILLPGVLVSPGLLVFPSGFRAPCVLRVLSVVLLRI